MGNKEKIGVLPGFQGIAFGLMDGLITMLGIIMGIAEATSDAKLVIITGVIGGIANGFANSIGLYASELAERGQQIQHVRNGRKTMIHTREEMLVASLLAFVSCIVALIVPIMPFFFFDITKSMILAFILSMILLFVLGIEVGRISEENKFRTGVKYMLAGTFGSIICYIVGNLMRHLFFNVG